MPYTLFRYAINIATAHVTLLSDDDEALDDEALEEKEGVNNTHYIDIEDET
jgi:hypothetical protein